PLVEPPPRGQARPCPNGLACEARPPGQRARRGLAFPRGRLPLGQAVDRETRADVPAVAQLALVPVAEQEGAERRARALALRDSADDELGAPGRLDLYPGWRALAGFVFAVLALGDDAFETARERRLVQFFPVFLRMHQ